MPAFIPATLRAIGDLAVTDSNFIVGNGTTWVAESGSTARSSIGLGTTNAPQFERFGVGAAAGATTGINVGNTALTGTIQIGVAASPVGTSAATSFVVGQFSKPALAAASFTCADVTGILVDNPSAFSGGAAATRLSGIYILDQTRGTSNYGVRCSVSLGSNKWGWFGDGTANNLTNGAWVLGQTTAPTPGTNRGAIYSRDNAGTAEVYVKDEANNETQISPHPRAVMDLHKSRMTTLGLTPLKCTWGYESTNDILGVTTSVDMGMVVRCVEWLMNRASKPVSLIKETTFSPTVKWEDRHSAESAKYVSDVAAYRKALAELVAQPVPLRPDCATPPEWTGKSPIVKPKPAWMGV